MSTHIRKRVEKFCTDCGRTEADNVRLRVNPDGTMQCIGCRLEHGHKHGHGPTTKMNFNLYEMAEAFKAQKERERQTAV